MRILFLGGTQFVGRHMVTAALKKGYEVTLFNRGKTNSDLFPEALKIKGDRDGGLDPLKGKTWDVVVDVNGYVPRLVRDAASFLKGSVGQYIFVSTGSVYDMPKMSANSDENAPLQVLEDETTEEWNGPAYGGLKVLCEKAVGEIYAEDSLILRLGVVAGPFDPTDRVTYWVSRIAKGGEILIPGSAQRHIQFVDARDLADFTLLGMEKKLHGIYNTTGRSGLWEEFLSGCQKAAGSQATPVWVSDFEFLSKNLYMGAKDFGALPMVPPAEMDHIYTMNCQKALKAGMVFRSFEDTARDTLEWERGRSADEERQAGIGLEEEKELIDKWKAAA